MNNCASHSFNSFQLALRKSNRVKFLSLPLGRGNVICKGSAEGTILEVSGPCLITQRCCIKFSPRDHPGPSDKPPTITDELPGSVFPVGPRHKSGANYHARELPVVFETART